VTLTECRAVKAALPTIAPGTQSAATLAQGES